MAELEQRLNTKAANLLSRLCRQKRLTRYFTGRLAVYLAVDRRRQLQQRDQRDLSQPENQDTSASSDSNQPTCPPGCDVVLVLEVLIQINICILASDQHISQPWTHPESTPS